MPLQSPGTFRTLVCDSHLDLPDRLQQCGAQGVVHRLGEDIGAGCHQVRADVERRARFEPALDDDARLVDLEGLADFLQVLLDERGERGG